MTGRVLIIAGSDSGGGAGIQADIKTVTALGGYAATAITALTAQNTLGVQGVFPVTPEFIEAQIAAVLDDIGADCVKTGMLGDGPVIEVVAATL
ncbi:MAG TPA: bifunctional hydroxymethylpyrimidine kinase/phosphomethylpyrimidine kinase, partial [Alphaproteobacteria bacterium]|nr:bifunctional hydroxymethylpyrimidine kinase/phosphomethylpyrimidine kinase [Alphaproteobacteria bacterium]